MGYLFLTISLICATAKGYCAKRISAFSNHFSDALSLNLLRMLLCSLLGFALVLFQGKQPALHLDGHSMQCVLWSAISNSAFVVLWLMCAHEDAYMLINVFLMLGTIVTVAGSALIPALGETVSVKSIVGLVLMIVSAAFMKHHDQQQMRRKMSAKSFLLLCITALSSGLYDLSQKYYMKVVPAADATVFSFYTFLFSSALLICIKLAFRSPLSLPVSEIRKTILPNIMAMSLFLFGCSFFKTLASARLPSVYLYPLFQSASMLLAAIMSSLLLHEAFGIYSIISIIFSLFGVFLIGMT